MSEELRAAERLRQHREIDEQCKKTGKWSLVMGCPYFNCDRCNPDRIRKDELLLADAYLAEHPADDGEPITTEWLEFVGAKIVPFKAGVSANFLIEDYGGTEGNARVELHLVAHYDKGMLQTDEWITDVVSYGNDGEHEEGVGLVRSWCRTRGDVRLLCQALGIPLQETDND